MKRLHYLVISAVIILFDIWTKWLITASIDLHEAIPVIPNLFQLVHVRNTGAAFGLLSGLPPMLRIPLFVGVTIVAVGALVSYLRQVRPDEPWLAGALGAVLGGAAGNLLCRLRYGEVVDFLHLHYRSYDWPMFNVADSAITVGVAIVLLHSLRAQPQERAA